MLSSTLNPLGKLLVLWVATIFISHHAYATNFAEEQKTSDDLIRTSPPGEVMWLDTEEEVKVFALFKPSAVKSSKGAIIILHDNNQNPDWPVITRPLREYFPGYGWATLSVQMPTLPEIPDEVLIDELYQHTEKRIRASVEFLNQEKIERKIIVAQGMSANMALKFASIESNIEPIHSLIVISAYDNNLVSSSDYISNIPINILDIIAENDWPSVLTAGQKRLSATNFASNLRPQPQNILKSSKLQALALNKTGNLRFRQEIITGANHYFDTQTEHLLKIIRGWINRFNES